MQPLSNQKEKGYKDAERCGKSLVIKKITTLGESLSLKTNFQEDVVQNLPLCCFVDRPEFFLIDRLTLRFTALDVKLLDYVYLIQFLRYYGMTNDRTLKRAQNV